MMTTGPISKTLARMLLHMDEPDSSTKFTATERLNLLGETITEVVNDLWATTDSPPVSSYTITLAPRTLSYQLPANVGEILEVAKRDSSGVLEWELKPRSFTNPLGYGIRFDGNQRLVLSGDHRIGESVTIQYVPSGEQTLFTGRIQTSGNFGANTIKIGNALSTAGELDQRDNGLVGCVVTLWRATATDDVTATELKPTGWSVFPVTTRVITAWDRETGTITVDPALPASLLTFAGTDYVWLDIYPAEFPGLWSACLYGAVMKMLALEVKSERYKLIERNFIAAKRTAALKWANLNLRAPASFRNDVPDNQRYAVWW